jgi:hypothetical protein
VEKAVATETSTEEVAEETTENTPAVDEEKEETVKSTESTVAEADQAAEDSAEREEKIQQAYVGPSIPMSRLRKGMILTGTENEIKNFLDGLVDKYPEIPYLLVDVDRLADAQEKVQKKGNILHKYYQDMLAKARVPGKRG